MSADRTAQRLRQEAWKRLSAEWKDDPEACFVFGFQAGLGAVAPRVEPPVMESGGGFESHPASAHDAWTPDDTAYRPGGLAQPKQGLKNSTEPPSEVTCSKIFKQATGGAV